MPQTEQILSGLTLIVVLGISAQWVAWRLRLPSILVLLGFGFLAGPVAGILDPRAVLGPQLIQPLVSISVAIILFEGGLSLRLADLRHIGAVVRNLVSTGALVTWGLAALAARLFLTGEGPDGRLGVQIALLLGAILVVTGPTVIIPLLRHVRPKGRLEPILRWEGIVIDPIGATLAVLVFEAITASFAPSAAAWHFLVTMLTGGIYGLVGAALLWVMLRLFLIPDYLQNAVPLALVVGVFTAANMAWHESGIFAVTVMGIALANQRSVPVRHIVEFKENLQVLLISILFIVLAAGLEIEHLSRIDLGTILFLAALILVVRPAAVLLSTFRSRLGKRERIFLAMMAPRGIVAAAVASVFALRLESHDPPIADSGLLLPYTFAVIVVTVAFYGLGAPLVARWLRLSEPNPQGCVIIGAHAWARAIAAALRAAGCRVLLVDTNRANLQAARMEGLEIFAGNALAAEILEELPLDGMGRLLALTSNDEVNALAAVHFRDVFHRGEIYQLAPAGAEKQTGAVPSHLRGRYLFGEGITFARIQERFDAGAAVKSTQLTAEFTPGDFRARHGEDALPLFYVSEGKRITMVTRKRRVEPQVGQLVISLVGGTGRAAEAPVPEMATALGGTGDGEGREAAADP
jgi:NhaP-type Na+/H+ or K+/H+ antiporter